MSFSGWYQSDESKSRIDVTVQHMRFGIKLKTESLSGTLRAKAGGPDLFVELIEFNGNMETASVTGHILEFEVQPTSDGRRMSVRSVPGT